MPVGEVLFAFFLFQQDNIPNPKPLVLFPFGAAVLLKFCIRQ